VALDKSTGKERWRTPREEATSWTTPVVAEIDGKPQVIVSGTSAIRGYDLATGRELWTGPGLTGNVIPTPIVAGDVLYAMSGFRAASLQVLKLGGSGDLAGSEAVLWSYNRHTPYVPSPLLVNDLLYFVSGNNAILSCLDADSGSINFSAERLEGINGIYASPVAARNHLYVLGRNGVCLVLSEGTDLKIVAANKLDEETEASPALAGRDLFIRGHSSLYCLRDQ
jgi:outer membrane protein assembly factor BamB